MTVPRRARIRPPLLRLRLERLRHKWSQSDAACRTGISQQDISLIEQGRLLPRPHELQRLGEVFGISPASVLLTPIMVVDDREELTESREIAHP